MVGITGPLVARGNAQTEPAGVIAGTVTDSASGAPLAAAEILTAGVVVARTDPAGRFLLSLAPGVHNVAARLVGFQPAGHRLRVAPADTLVVAFRLTGAQLLPTLRADAPAPAVGWRVGFDARRTAEFGAFITEEMLRGQEHRSLSVALKEHAAGIRFNHYEAETIAVGRGGCAMAVWVDGLRLYAGTARALMAGGSSQSRRRPTAGLTTTSAVEGGPPNIEQWRIGEIAAIEVYVGAARTPMQYQVTGSACGTILIWTKAGMR